MKATALAALVLVALGSLRIVSTYNVFNHTIDEPDHLAAGMEYLHTGKYRYEDQHPPLARVFAAILPSLAGETFRAGPDSYREGYRILGHGEHYDRILKLGRAGVLPFFWLASLVVFLWSYRHSGAPGALVSTLLFTTLPPVLAHAGLITTDMALACFAAAAGLASLYWSHTPTRTRSVVFGAMIGLACLSKLSALIFLPAAWLAMYACHVYRSYRGIALVRREIEERLSALGIVAGVAALVIWAGYAFSFARVDFLHMRLPAARFFSGIQSVWAHNRAGHPSYILGARSLYGFWFYFPVVLAVKTPLALLLLLPGVVWAGFRRCAYPLAFSGGILLCAMASRIDIGVRHILPVYVGFAIAAGAVASWAWQAKGIRGHVAKAAVGLLLVWHVASGMAAHPDYLAYTNEIAGDHAENFVADSDLDWGQDMKRLGVFLDRNGATQVTFSPFNRTYPLAGHDFPAMAPGESEHPSPGWNAVSITIWKVFGFPAWADRIPPQARVGRSILVWYFPE